MSGWDLNDAGPQQTFPVAPAGKYKARIEHKMGNAGPTLPGNVQPFTKSTAKDSNGNLSDYVYMNLSFHLLSGQEGGANKRVFENLGVAGGKLDEAGNSIAFNITRSRVRAILNSARNLNPKDESAAARALRIVEGPNLNGIECVIDVGVRKDKMTGEDRNFIKKVVEPDDPAYLAVMQGMPAGGQQAALLQKADASSWGGGNGAPVQQADASSWGGNATPAAASAAVAGQWGGTAAPVQQQPAHVAPAAVQPNAGSGVVPEWVTPDPV
jgi:hypothetical protein